MQERQIDEQALKTSALEVVDRLKRVVAERARNYPLEIEAVWVFSGPGTYYDRLKPEQEEWMRWMDRDRIRAGVAVTRKITAARIMGILGTDLRHKVSKDDVSNFGPLLVYNGVPINDPNLQHENNIFRKTLDSQFCKLPKDKVVIIDEIIEDDGSKKPLFHTGDQVKSFYQQLSNPKSPLRGITNVALVAHIPDFARIVFYTKKYNDEFMEKGNAGLNFWVYAIKSRSGTEQTHIDSELPRLVTYAQWGHLAIEPSPFRV